MRPMMSDNILIKGHSKVLKSLLKSGDTNSACPQFWHTSLVLFFAKVMIDVL